MDFSLKTKWLDLVKDGAAVLISAGAAVLLQKQFSLPTQPEFFVAEIAVISVVINYLKKSFGL